MAGDEPPVPVQKRLRGDEEYAPAILWQEPAESREQHPVVRLKSRSFHVSTQHRQLVAQHDDLQLFGALARASNTANSRRRHTTA
jgi:hypothetical protein